MFSMVEIRPNIIFAISIASYFLKNPDIIILLKSNNQGFKALIHNPVFHTKKNILISNIIILVIKSQFKESNYYISQWKR